MTHDEDDTRLRTIALEEHYATTAFMRGPGRQLEESAESVEADLPASARSEELIDKLRDIEDGRIADMDAADIDVQVLSLTAPGVEQLDASEARELAHDANNRLADAVRRHPDRFMGFAALPTPTPDAAADELERTVDEYGFDGAVINGHTKGLYLDDEFFWPILDRAEELRVPLYLHPTPPTNTVTDALYTGNFAPPVANMLATASWGWHIDTALHVVRLVLSGAFDRYPDLQLVVGHLGESLPFMLPRLESTLPREATGLDRPIGAYFRDNLYYTISGFNYLPPFHDLFSQVGADRILFSTDYPYASMEEARAFLDRLPVSPADREKIAHENAERLFDR